MSEFIVTVILGALTARPPFITNERKRGTRVVVRCYSNIRCRFFIIECHFVFASVARLILESFEFQRRRFLNLRVRLVLEEFDSCFGYKVPAKRRVSFNIFMLHSS